MFHSLDYFDAFVKHVMDEKKAQEYRQLSPEDYDRCTGESNELSSVCPQPVVDRHEDQWQGENIRQRTTHVEHKVELGDCNQGPPDGHMDAQQLL